MQIWKPRNHLQGQETNKKNPGYSASFKFNCSTGATFDNDNEKSIIEKRDKNYVIKGEIR